MNAPRIVILGLHREANASAPPTTREDFILSAGRVDQSREQRRRIGGLLPGANRSRIAVPGAAAPPGVGSRPGYRIGSCTVTSLVPSGNVASTCTSWIISAMPSIT
jgi:hypothetical protein